MAERGPPRADDEQEPRPTSPAARDPGGAAPPGVPGGGRAEDDYLSGGERDPGDAVPPGVAPLEPAPLTEEDQRALEKLRDLPNRG